MKTKTLFLTMAMLLAASVFAQTPNKTLSSKSPARAQSFDPRYGLLNLSNITAWLRADGYSNHSPRGFIGSTFPRGKVGAIYQDGVVWGGKAYLDAAHTQPAPFNQLIRVGGATYGTGSRAGRILGFGANAAPADPLAPEARVYRIRRDYFFMNEEELRRDAAEVYEIEPAAVTATHMQTVRAQYETDWNAWPVAFGAPFIDRNNNGRFDPPPPFSANFTLNDLVAGNYDEPGIAMGGLDLPAGQVLWAVCNDLDVAQNQTFAGAHPLGLEVQFTLWSYRDLDELQNVFFRRVRLINKGGVAIDTLGNKGALWLDQIHLGQWVDPDLGFFGDDRAGCDLELNMGYAYNGYDLDAQFRQFDLPPGAVGIALLQGPRFPSAGSTALFDFKPLIGWRNHAMTAFWNKYTGSGFTEPTPGNYHDGALLWHKLLRGYMPIGGPEVYASFPPGYTPGPLPYSGDPVSNTGFFEGVSGDDYTVVPGERRMLISAGPFACAPGDTQEAVYACIGGLGADRLSSIAVLRQIARAVQNLYNGLYSGLQQPATTVSVSFPNAGEAAIFIRAETQQRQVTRLTARLEPHAGNANAFVVPLFDDGQHGDALPNDGVFAASLTIPKQGVGYFLDILVNDNLAASQRFNHVVEMITTIDGVELGPPEIFSDNINQDRTANPGENVRYGFLVRNLTDFELNGLRVTPLLEYEPGKNIFLSKIAPHTQTFVLYDGNDPATFLSAEIPASHATSYHVPLLLKDRNYNCWKDTLTFAVVPLPAPYREAQMAHTIGRADGNFELRIIAPQNLKNHEYQILGVDSIDAEGNRGITLKNATENRVLLQNHPLPDTLGHNMPVLEGFKILRGTIPDQSKAGMANWSVPSGKQVWIWQNFITSLRLEGFNGTIGWDEPGNFFAGGGKTLKPTDLKNTLIRFAQTDTNGNVLDANDPNWSFAYRYGRGFGNPPARPEFASFIINPTGGYSFQDFKKSVPFSAWDMEANPPRRLAIGFLENNVVNGMVDGKHWPPAAQRADNVNGSGPREWFFIFAIDYSEAPVASLMKEMIGNRMPVMWWGTPARNGNVAFASGDEFLINALHVITAQDAWSFNPVALRVAEESGPLTYALAQNYPNPFNPETHIAFSLPRAARVRLEIFNLMGQRVSVLFDEKLAPGKYTNVWRGVNSAGESVASGVYFYRLEIGDRRHPDFAQTRKLLLLR